MNAKPSHESDALRAFAEKHIKAAPVPITSIDIKVNLASKVLTEYAVELFANARVAVEMAGGSILFTEQELVTYVQYLVRLRCDYVNGKKVPFGPVDLIAVPSFVSVVLQNLGKVYYLDLGLELRPIIDSGSDSKGSHWSDEEIALLKKVSRGILALGNYGLEYAKGYDRNKEGSFEFMSMAVLDDVVMGLNKEAHPVYALLASFVELRGIEDALSPRITYGAVSHFKILIRHLAQLKG